MKRKLAGLAVLTGMAAATTLLAPTTPAQASVGLYRVTATSVLDATNSKTMPISCNGADQVVGAGGKINDGQGDVLMTRMYADAALHTVTVVGVEANATNVPWSVGAYAVCAPAGTVAGLQLVTTTSANNALDKVGITAVCPAGKKTFGGGYRIDNANGAVAIDELAFTSALGSVSSTAYVFGAPGNFTLQTQAFCANPLPAMALLDALSASDATSPKPVPTLACPAGSQTAGVGGVLNGLLGAGSVTTLVPKVALDTAEATGREIVAFAGVWTLRAQQICVG
ncbi:hypothetical protein [Micromonospora lupini]|uniref:Secreted protein n=1 Tax=Micromonospora lupini str. Lupac 08 TaxID=1150864 RepID=I0L4F7_9ACTN|nr:hypothetical protein [Micromonospora lupini]CCH18704.1 conserved exported hypothetical protein [Micromonospora lupini str. Lupac 08]